MFTKLFWKDLTERVVFTYAEAFLGLLIAGPFVEALTAGQFDLGAAKAAAAAAVVSVLAVAKGAVAAARPRTVSPASLASSNMGH